MQSNKELVPPRGQPELTKAQKIISTVSVLGSSIDQIELLCIKILGTDEKTLSSPDPLQSNESILTLLNSLPEIITDFSKRVDSVSQEIEKALF